MKVSKVSYPKAKMASFGFSEEPLAVYDGTVELMATLKTDDSVEPGPRSIPGKVTFQACNDQACLPPSTVDVTATVEITPGEEKDTGSLTVTGAPPLARVSIDGRPVGKVDAGGRFVARKVEAGRRRVRVEADGFAPFEQVVAVDATRAQTVTVSMSAPAAAAESPTPDSSAPPAGTAAEAAAQPAPVPTPAPAEDARPTSNVPFGLIGALVGAAIAAVFVLARRRAAARPTPHAK
jgi:hypothetical protein